MSGAGKFTVSIQPHLTGTIGSYPNISTNPTMKLVFNDPGGSLSLTNLSGSLASLSAVQFPTLAVSGSSGSDTWTPTVATYSLTYTPPPNNPPTISGTPGPSATAGTWYSFTPTAGDADNDTLTFSIANKPAWATFSAASGMLSGTPPAAGTFGNIQISVSDGKGGSASLAAFSITVAAQGGGGGGTPVPVMNGWWLLPGALAGMGMLARRRRG